MLRWRSAPFRSRDLTQEFSCIVFQYDKAGLHPDLDVIQGLNERQRSELTRGFGAEIQLCIIRMAVEAQPMVADSLTTRGTQTVKRSQLRAWYLGRTWICKILVDTDVRMCCQFNSDWMLSWIYFFFFYYFVWLVIQEHSKQHNLHTSCYNGRNLYVCRLNRINRGILLTTLDLKDYKNTFRLQLFLPVFCIFLPCHSRRLNIMMNILGKTESKTDVPVHDCTCWRFQENK